MIFTLCALGMLIPGVVVVLLLRTFLITNPALARLREPMDMDWRDYRPLHRLLDPSDFEFLRQRGFPEQRIRKLRAERRRIYRLCLRSMAQDFNRVYGSLNLALLESRSDNSALAAELSTQRMTFYRNLMLAEWRLFLHRFGLEKIPAIDLVKPLEVLQARLQMSAPIGAAA